MNETKLLPCPFCGEKPVVEDLTDRDIGFFIICENIDCPAPSISVNSDSGTLEDATKNWNTRVYKNNWIKVENELPEIDRGIDGDINYSRSVLVKVDGDIKYVAWRCKEHGREENNYFTSDTNIDDVTHWMDLPD